VIVIGLTGSIGMGKSTVCGMFRDLGAVVWNADEAVHRLYAPGGAAVAALHAAFPGSAVGGAVDRDKLSKIILRNPDALARIEAIVHPLVGKDRAAFLKEAKKNGAEIAVLDIPLLFEKGHERGFDATVVVSAPAAIQRERVLARPGMTEEKFAAILSKQMPDCEKRHRADYVISTGQPRDATRAEVAIIVEELRRRFAGKQST
jgi:dephospho-CoA kinase